MAADHRIVADLDIRPRPPAGAHAIEEVLDVIQVHVLAIRPVGLPRDADSLVLANTLVDPVSLRQNLPALPVDDQDPLLAVKHDAVLPVSRSPTNTQGMLPDHRELWKLV